MISKYFLHWHDYDGMQIETFETSDALEKRYTDLVNEHKGDNEHGFRVDGVVFGVPVIMEPQDVVKVYRARSYEGL